MAVDNVYRATDSLILPSPRKYYRATVHAYHWQLRSLLSSPHGDYIYYPSGTCIYRINTRTSKRELITNINFAPRCLSAARGWICCGGEDGRFAVIRFVEDKPGAEARSEVQAAAADSRLPLELDPSRRSDSPGSASADVKERSFIRSVVIGGEIVNCVTFWFPPPNPSADLHSAPVVVLANNDRTVTIADLQSSEELQAIEFADCINRAVISPDGRLLVAIGDDPYMYIYNRRLVTTRGQSTIPSSESNPKLKPKYEWTLASKIQLVGQRLSDKADTRGSFAASFSKSGKYLAIGTQYGVICVFDATLLEDPDADPLIQTFTTSRPNSKRGAVRDIAFSPEPYDLLTWTENTGRVGIADVRDNFMSRQIICIDSRAEGMKRMSLFDGDEALVPAEPETRSRAAAESRSQTEQEGGRSDSPDLLSESVENRRLREELANDILQHTAPETSGAFEVLQALQEQRAQREASRQAQLLASDGGTSNNTSATMSGARAASSSALSRYREMLAAAPSTTLTTTTTTASSTLPSILRDFTSADRSNTTLRTYIVGRNQERERSGQPPRRRGSIILDAAGRALDREREISELRAARASRSENPQDARSNPPRLHLPAAIGSESSSSAWADLETLYSIAIDDEQRFLGTSEVTMRRLAERGLGEFRSELRSGYGRQSGLLRIPPHVDPDETTGCCWSPNGRVLYVGTEDGIFEYPVNTISRKFFPSMVFR